MFFFEKGHLFVFPWFSKFQFVFKKCFGIDNCRFPQHHNSLNQTLNFLLAFKYFHHFTPDHLRIHTEGLIWFNSKTVQLHLWLLNSRDLVQNSRLNRDVSPSINLILHYIIRHPFHPNHFHNTSYSSFNYSFAASNWYFASYIIFYLDCLETFHRGSRIIWECIARYHLVFRQC